VKALIIDDEEDICYLLGSLLRDQNLDTDYVNSLKEATTFLEAGFPEIIFLDNHLPDGKGLYFIQYIKEKSPSTKVVMITAFDTPDDRKKALQEGADEFIGKPFSRASVSQAVESLLPA
jgi:two-component system, OmpR family, response regulator